MSATVKTVNAARAARNVAPVAPAKSAVQSAAAFKAHATMKRAQAVKARGSNRAALLASAAEYDARAAETLANNAPLPRAAKSAASSNQRAAAFRAWATMTRRKITAARGKNRAVLVAKADEYDRLASEADAR